MDDINMRQFLFWQPNGEVEQSTDKAYLRLCNRLYHTWKKQGLLPEAPDDLKKVVCLGLIGYFQDIMTDAGVWRVFIDRCQAMYGRYVPFHDDREGYILYELNLEDVEFMVWYYLAFNSMQFRFTSPIAPSLLKLAAALHKVLEEAYDDMPAPQDYKALMECELHAPDDAEKLYDLGQWLFWRNWLMLPPFQLTYSQIYSQFVEIQQRAADPAQAQKDIEEARTEVMSTFPTGPLALYMREWMSLLLDGKMPKPPKAKAEAEPKEPKEHPYYTAFTRATGGKTLCFIKTYDELNRFFIKGMGWAEGEEHLPQFKGHENFVLMVTPDKGLMVAKNIALCVRHPDNPLYDADHASRFAFTLISQRAVCPADMLIYLCSGGYLPDARFPESAMLASAAGEPDTTALVAANWDFLARAYLQEFYRADL